ncbi:AEL122Wp [Eremothecium gossypii ATCC 10895]|uniref:Farnesyl pyrophosphate synthase n=1 Tax=Eremothecium gossypii (strain ATCC 10895 / CBS 109.51 / FGSC 9923 / NRRL Y-1056) TaxID=284811 RepID=Q757Y2_EREGS|nr:AEL122Wp [Eremothecium gossypii ATCC 10895]AAS52563.1 AEL122Wp [Eremothecium gossypii ATCC 10895]AEY96864.1 FAEL122Wp [Eremothecium gossypii FDAG1]
MTKEDNRKKFVDEFPSLVSQLTQSLREYGIPQDAIDWYEKSLNYNTPGGKLNRGLSVVDTYVILKNCKSPLDLPVDEYRRVALLGWCVELLQAYFLVADDMMDKSITRRGQPCWYRVEEVGDMAINDAFMLEAAIYCLLKRNFRDQPYYVDLLELLHDVTFQTEVGQLLDLMTAPEFIVDLNKFSLQRHSYIVIFKTAYYSFYLPVALAMYAAGVNDERDFAQAREVLLPLGEYFQIQDDYLDCFGRPEDIGKIGTDIQDNKCSWVINAALKLCSPEQRKILDENYGRKDPECEQRCKQIFYDLKLQEVYERYEEQVAARLRERIGEIDESRGFRREVLYSFLDKVYRRKK